ncbi:MAG TPA: hypothetical protein VJ986_14770, partial [Gaiellaceae bacterium]|nr:hypothetical protein [Gaiellaceae bacterium]
MPRRRRKTKLRPRVPSRVKKTKRKTRKPRSRQHPELWGLGCVALGVFVASILYFGWNGGYAGRALVDGLDAMIGAAAYGLPVLLVGLGLLMVGKSALVDVRPFRTGLVVLAAGLMIALGRGQGGYLGSLLGGAVGVAVGATGSTILGILLILVGSLLLSGASLGAILRRSGRTVRLAAAHARTRRAERETTREPWPQPIAPAPSRAARAPMPVNGEEAYPDVVGDEPPHTMPEPAQLAPSPLGHADGFSSQEPLVAEQATLFDEVTSDNPEYRLPDPAVLHVSPEVGGSSEETSARVADLLV